ncbi:MAG: Type II secretion envelope pseudopilin protein (PulG,guides folded protein to PulD in outer membrane) [uncultured Sulfurovum sp.]|uniref:Type II secretion envelope pseudopilin protein (PulG,guides folded protein to PulD in outer membrane) n=1 Tax=uncultured Sulfurovum sp. TaxID=269237 RepID=A0A6S6TA94_9BACT|nr:MAG: Type II secretion envelope pseudopilin protein (PulG,guides folded protein to PulD in outer membrane) [uncultured Sulfurovum sp.]
MQNRKAFTMVELIFVIVIIGILSAVAIPKLAATRDDAVITVGVNTLASVRNAIATERQKRILRGDFTGITNLDNDGDNTRIFTSFNTDNRDNNNSILEYPVKQGTNAGEWQVSGTTYTFYFTGGSCAFTLANNRLSGNCPQMGL